MIIYIKLNKDNQFFNLNAYQVYEGFKKKGFQIKTYHNIYENHVTPNNIVFGGHYDVRQYLGNKYPEPIDYPNYSYRLYRRSIKEGVLSDYLDKYDALNEFIKPKQSKLFKGRVINNFKDIIDLKQFEKEKIYISQVIHYKTEWRVYVSNQNIIDIRRYKGEYDNKIDIDFVKTCIKNFTNLPIAYGLDIGLDINGDCSIVEVNDSHSLGSYGINSFEYCNMIFNRWEEIYSYNSIK